MYISQSRRFRRCSQISVLSAVRVMRKTTLLFVEDSTAVDFIRSLYWVMGAFMSNDQLDWQRY